MSPPTGESRTPAYDAKYRDVARRHTITLAAVGRHADRHLPLHLARAVDAAEAASADALLERLVDHEMRLTRLFHDATDAGDWRGSCATVREIARVSELLARVNDALPHHPDTAVQPMFVWPDGALPDRPLRGPAEYLP